MNTDHEDSLVFFKSELDKFSIFRIDISSVGIIIEAIPKEGLTMQEIEIKIREITSLKNIKLFSLHIKESNSKRFELIGIISSCVNSMDPSRTIALGANDILGKFTLFDLDVLTYCKGEEKTIQFIHDTNYTQHKIQDNRNYMWLDITGKRFKISSRPGIPKDSYFEISVHSWQKN